jgi:hypothetical protein
MDVARAPDRSFTSPPQYRYDLTDVTERLRAADQRLRSADDHLSTALGPGPR